MDYKVVMASSFVSFCMVLGYLPVDIIAVTLMLFLFIMLFVV